MLLALEKLFQTPPWRLLTRADDLLGMDPGVWDALLGDDFASVCPTSDWPNLPIPIHLLAADAQHGAVMHPGDEDILRPVCPQLTTQTIIGSGHKIHRKNRLVVTKAISMLIQRSK